MAAGTESNTAGAAETGEKWTSWKVMEQSDADAGDDSLHDRGKTSNMSTAAAAQSMLPDIAVHHHQLLLLLQTPAMMERGDRAHLTIVADAKLSHRWHLNQPGAANVTVVLKKVSRRYQMELLEQVTKCDNDIYSSTGAMHLDKRLVCCYRAPTQLTPPLSRGDRRSTRAPRETHAF
ncbi:hypothetical protein BHM03_00055623 [Ensete ventricosum]|uniref:Uncharacterized protein n=1 Tax=Ensete ventricosum TaxID=4639 RepID=A0A426ZI46_ENSVE|nr:hypothetical protein B296_00021853 [Ensete ventricosum]RZS22793.1 hypothetical protein BHM03_00055623 [Ensete ventricosum]